MSVSSRLSVFMVDYVRVSSCLCQVGCLSSWLTVSGLVHVCVKSRLSVFMVDYVRVSSCLCQVDCLSSWLTMSGLVHVCVK